MDHFGEHLKKQIASLRSVQHELLHPSDFVGRGLSADQNTQLIAATGLIAQAVNSLEAIYAERDKSS